jgi:hypothetical protein
MLILLRRLNLISKTLLSVYVARAQGRANSENFTWEKIQRTYMQRLDRVIQYMKIYCIRYEEVATYNCHRYALNNEMEV